MELPDAIPWAGRSIGAASRRICRFVLSLSTFDRCFTLPVVLILFPTLLFLAATIQHRGTLRVTGCLVGLAFHFALTIVTLVVIMFKKPGSISPTAIAFMVLAPQTNFVMFLAILCWKWIGAPGILCCAAFFFLGDVILLVGRSIVHDPSFDHGRLTGVRRDGGNKPMRP